MNDTRKDGRLSVSLVARYREPSMLDLREGECQDLSINGMFIQTPKPSPRGALIRFECDAGRPENNFRGTGRVVWQRRKADSRGPAGMGVRFVRLESGDHDALERIIAALNEAASATAAGVPANVAAAKLAATLRGQPPVLDPRTGAVVPFETRTDGPNNGAPGATAGPSRPPMPTLLEVPRHPLPSNRIPPAALGNTLPGPGGARPDARVPDEGSPAEPDGKATLLGVAAPSAPASGRPEPAGPAFDDRAPGHGKATVIEAPRTQGAGPGTSSRAPDARSSNAGRGGRKKGRDKRRSGAPTPSNGAPTQETAVGPSASERSHMPGEPPLELNEGFAPEYGGRRRRLPIDDDGDDRPDSVPARTSSGTVMWLVLGTGLVVSWGLVTLFGTVPIGVAPKPEAEAHDKSPSGAANPEPPVAPSPAASESVETPPHARRFAVFVETRPPGARVMVGTQSVVAPARVELDSIQPPPLVVVAELAGYKQATVNIWPSEFQAKGTLLEYRLTLDMQPQPTATAAAPPKEPSRPPTPPQPPRATPPAPEPPARSNKPEAEAEPAPVASKPPTPDPVPAPEPAPPAPAPSGGGALAAALDCLGRGDNRCVIRALENRATSAREVELLIETYRAMGATPKAEREMQRYLQSYPNGKRAAEYRRMLERRGAKVQ